MFHSCLKPFPIINQYFVKDLKEISRAKEIQVVLIPNFEWFNDNNLGIYDRLYQVHNITTLRSGGRTRFESREELDSYMSDYEYFITTPGDVGVFYQTDKEAFDREDTLIGENYCFRILLSEDCQTGHYSVKSLFKN